MSSYHQTQETESYKNTVQAISTLDQPVAGFSKKGSGPTTNQEIIIKQNNFIIQLLTQVAESTRETKEEVTELKRAFRELKRQETKDGVTAEAIQELTDKLKNTTIGGKTVVKTEAGPIRVFKNPLEIYKEEKRKIV